MLVYFCELIKFEHVFVMDSYILVIRFIVMLSLKSLQMCDVFYIGISRSVWVTHHLVIVKSTFLGHKFLFTLQQHGHICSCLLESVKAKCVEETYMHQKKMASEDIKSFTLIMIIATYLSKA